MTPTVQRGDICYADLDPVVGSEQGGQRPVLVVQNNVGNKYSPTTIIAPISSQKKKKMPTHVYVPYGIGGLPRDSVILTEQIRVLDKTRIHYTCGRLPSATMKQVDAAIRVSVLS